MKKKQPKVFHYRDGYVYEFPKPLDLDAALTAVIAGRRLYYINKNARKGVAFLAKKYFRDYKMLKLLVTMGNVHPNRESAEQHAYAFGWHA